MRAVLLFAFFIALFVGVVDANEDTHKYKDGEAVVVYASKIGPVNNPLETYDFFKQPGCPAASTEMKPPTLGQALAGEELYPMLMKVEFNTDASNALVCKLNPSKEERSKWEYMIRNQYSYKLTIDGLPVWGLFGVMNEGKPFIYQHRSIFFGVNGDQIVNVSLKEGKAAPLEDGYEYSFTYSARFLKSKAKFEDRYAMYVDSKALKPATRWFSIINSVLLVIFLVAVVLFIISRTLRADFAKIDEERRLQFEGHDTFDNSGWKQLYADVFRVPRFPAVLAALDGSGKQLYVLLFLTIAAGAADATNPVVGQNRAGVAVVLYAITSFVGGYVSSADYARFSVLSPPLAKRWTKCFAFTQIALPGLFFSSTMITNTVASLYGSSQVIHFGSLLLLFVMWLFVSCPLSLVGTFLGRYVNRRGRRRKDIPHVNQIPRLVPKPRNLISRPQVLFLLSGALPFITIFIELYLVMASFWQDKSYQVYGFLTLTLLIYSIVTACTSIAATFILLSSENHQWRWMSFAFGASYTVYVFAYAVYFYLFKTKMTGLYMTVFYFSYTWFFCAVLACIGGSISYYAASVFVSKIYSQAKRD